MALRRLVGFLIGFLLFFSPTFLLLQDPPFSTINLAAAQSHQIITAGIVGFSGGTLGLLLSFFLTKKPNTTRR